MTLKARRSPVPNEHCDKDNSYKPSSSSKNNTLRYAANNVNSNRLNIIIILVLIGIFIAICNLLELRRFGSEMRKDVPKFNISNDNNSDKLVQKPIVWISGQRIESGYLNHIIDIFERLGFQKTFNGSDGNWDVLWSHEYPFMNNFITKLKPNQRVNHFPGSGFITNKVHLATSDLKHIPIAFNLPNEKETFLKHAYSNPEKLWVQKSSNHRGIKVENIEDLDLDASGTFIQEYIRNPLLIDGKKFDIGIYTIMTSISPLRVYIYGTEALLRFCAKPYYPFNKTDIDSYVVGDDYTPIWMMPSLQKYFINLNLNMKEALNSYLRSIGKDPNKIWQQIEECIRSVYMAKEDVMYRIASAKYESMRHFFEMVRFDFALDDDLNVFLMEANMSPNLSSSHFAPNKWLYEQVIFNMMSLVGLTKFLQFPQWSDRPSEKWNMMVTNKDLSVYEEKCSSDECHLSCVSSECDVCYHCLKDNVKITLKDAVLEHLSQWNSKRIIPSTSQPSIHPKGTINELQNNWFKGKCIQDQRWCD